MFVFHQFYFILHFWVRGLGISCFIRAGWHHFFGWFGVYLGWLFFRVVVESLEGVHGLLDVVQHHEFLWCVQPPFVQQASQPGPDLGKLDPLDMNGTAFGCEYLRLMTDSDLHHAVRDSCIVFGTQGYRQVVVITFLTKWPSTMKNVHWKWWKWKMYYQKEH